MKNPVIKKYLILGLLIAGGLMGALSGCGRKEYQRVSDKRDGQQLTIREELQWKSGFCWPYFPLNESEGRRKIGYFTQTKNARKWMRSTKEGAFGEVNTWQGWGKIEVCHDVLSEEAFFSVINSHAKELTEKYPEKEVVYRINSNTEIDQFVQLDVGHEHWLYIRFKDSVYTLYGKMDNGTWRNFLEEWLFTFGLKWNGAAVLREDGTVSDTYAEKKWAGMWRMIQWGEDCMKVDENVALFHRQEDGFYFKTESGGVAVEEVVLHPADICLEHNSWEEAVSYFVDRYPDMYSLKVSLYGEDTLWNSDKKAFEQIFYKVEEPEGSHGFFLWNGASCEVLSCGKTGYNDAVDIVRKSMGYDDDSCFCWKKEEDGGIMYANNLESRFSHIKDLGNGTVIRIQAKIIGTIEGESDTLIYEAEIYDEKSGELLQEIQVDSTYAFESPFVFEDFNADGYLDITVRYFYGINGGSVSHYIFSPSKNKFVQLDPELHYYGTYSVDYETRRWYEHDHASVYSGCETVYQWKNEMDYEMIKLFSHMQTEGGISVEISRYENGREEILSDYIYSYEEYEERDDIWGTYYEDFIWEKELTDKSTGKKYMIRYAEVFLPEEAEKNEGIYYDGRIYVYDEDTYLVSVTHSEIVSESESIEWENGDGDKEQALVIHYADGGESTFYLSELIQPDYQPAE